MERKEEGFRVYVESMAKSTDDKTKKILPLVRKSLKSTRGDILDLGGGAGNLSLTLLSLAQKFNVGLTVIDIDPRMIEILKKKFGNCPQVNLVLGDVRDFNLGKHFSAIVCSSLLHEIFSRNKNVNDLTKTLRRTLSHLLPGGTLVIRDGIKPDPSQEIILLKPLKPLIYERLWKFAASYKFLTMTPRPLKIEGQEVIAISRELAYEFAVKYHYPEINWKIEMTEQFGFWAENDARRILKEAGLEIVYLKKYLLDYFKQLFSKDFELFKYENRKLVRLDYFDTHLVIAAKRIKGGSFEPL